MTLLLLLIACAESPSPPPPPPAPVAEPAPPPKPARRIVAVGDLHGDPQALRDVLGMARLADAEGHWTGGDAILVQTGDCFDRGPDSKGVIDALTRLEAEARAAGGRVVALLGNHEVMNLTGDLRYVSPDDVAGYGGAEARAAALGPDGDQGRWLRGHDAVAVIDGTVFVHGGVHADLADLGVAALNDGVRAGIVHRNAFVGPDGPLWYRGYVLDPEEEACPRLDRALSALGARRMVVGHTVRDSGRVELRCGGKLVDIDVGLSRAYGSHRAALEIVGDDVRELTPGG